MTVVRPLAGAGVVARAGDLVLVCEAEGDEVDDLLALVADVAAAGGDATQLVRRIAGLVASDDDGRFPACAVSGPAAGGKLAVLVYGAATVKVNLADGAPVFLAGAEAVTAHNRLVSGRVTSVRLGLPHAGSPDHRFRLDGGVVPGAGAVIDFAPDAQVKAAGRQSRSVEAKPAPRSEPDPEPERAAAPEPALDEAEPAMPAEPAPMGADDARPDGVSAAEIAAGAVAAVGGLFAKGAPAPSPVDDSGMEAEQAGEAEQVGEAEQAPPLPHKPVTVYPPEPPPPFPVYDEPVPAPEPPPVPEMSAPDNDVEPAVVVPVPEPAPPQLASEVIRAPDLSKPFVSVILAPGAVETDQLEPTAPMVETVDNRPIVIGVMCKNDHFNDPSLRYCQVCGISMAQQTLTYTEGPRPPLGILLLDDGMTFRLDADYLVGREPQQDPQVGAGAVRPLRLVDNEGIISRRHLRVALVGWEVQLIDLKSANGTYVRHATEAAPNRLVPERPFTIRPGTQVSVGRRWLRYESHRNP